MIFLNSILQTDKTNLFFFSTRLIKFVPLVIYHFISDIIFDFYNKIMQTWDQGCTQGPKNIKYYVF